MLGKDCKSPIEFSTFPSPKSKEKVLFSLARVLDRAHDACSSPTDSHWKNESSLPVFSFCCLLPSPIYPFVSVLRRITTDGQRLTGLSGNGTRCLVDYAPGTHIPGNVARHQLWRPNLLDAPDAVFGRLLARYTPHHASCINLEVNIRSLCGLLEVYRRLMLTSQTLLLAWRPL